MVGERHIKVNCFFIGGCFNGFVVLVTCCVLNGGAVLGQFPVFK